MLLVLVVVLVYITYLSSKLDTKSTKSKSSAVSRERSLFTSYVQSIVKVFREN